MKSKRPSDLAFEKEEKNLEVHYIEATEVISDIRLLIPELKRQGVEQINYIDPVDNWLQKRLDKGLGENGIKATQYNSPLFFKGYTSKEFLELPIEKFCPPETETILTETVLRRKTGKSEDTKKGRININSCLFFSRGLLIKQTIHKFISIKNLQILHFFT